jgi:hypothetical protein
MRRRITPQTHSENHIILKRESHCKKIDLPDAPCKYPMKFELWKCDLKAPNPRRIVDRRIIAGM